MSIYLLYSALFLILGFGLVVAFLTGASVIALFLVRVPFVPTPKKNVKMVIDALDLKPRNVFYDLGCGDGRFLIEAEIRGAKAIGFEISAWAYGKAILNIWRHQSKAKVIFKNFYPININDADAVFCFLLDSVMPKVETKLKKELKKGAKIVCYGFLLPSWPPKKIIETNPKDKKASKIYIYQK